jgi:tight adherence protein B
VKAVLAAVLLIASAVVATRGISSMRRARAAVRLGLVIGRPVRPPLVRADDAAIAAAAALLGGALVGPVWAVPLGGTAYAVRRLQARRARVVPPVVVQERFADAVGAIAAAVRAGSSLPQAIRYAATEADPPIRESLEHLVAKLDLGVPLDVGIDGWARDMGTEDGDLVAGALDLHRRSGGDLPAVLDQVTATIRDRVGIAREIRSLTAQARLSAWILGLLPVGFFAFLWLTARDEIEGALATPVGIACIVVGLALEGGAFLWIRSLLVVA